MSEIKCCIHLSKVPNSLPARIFTETTLAKCHTVRDHGRFHHFKHKNIILPDRVNTVDGYHVSCYRSFIGIVTEKVDKGASDVEGNKKLRLFSYLPPVISVLFIVRIVNIKNYDMKYFVSCFAYDIIF